MRQRALALSLAGACLVLAQACGLENEGVDPPLGQLNFPVGLALSSDQSTLFVANSNFDLRYNQGTIQAYDLDSIFAELSVCAGSPCEVTNTAAMLRPGGEVRMGSYPAGLALSSAGDRLYVPVRSETNLTFIDVVGSPDQFLSCGPSIKCDDAHRRGDESVATSRGVELPGDPSAVWSGSLEDLGGAVGSGDYVLVTDRSGRVALFLDQIEGGRGTPRLVHVLSNLAAGLSGIQFHAGTGLAYVTSSQLAEIGRVGIGLDVAMGDLERSFVYNAGSLRVIGLDDGADARDIAFDEDGRRAYVLSRRPESVLVVDLERADRQPGEAAILRVIEVGSGPSKIQVGELGVAPDARTFIFVSCFDTRDLYIIDAELGTLAAVVRGMSGPFEVAFDPVRQVLYVADFRASVVRVVDLSPLVLHDGRSVEVVGFLGHPRPVEMLR